MALLSASVLHLVLEEGTKKAYPLFCRTDNGPDDGKPSSPS